MSSAWTALLPIHKSPMEIIWIITHGNNLVKRRRYRTPRLSVPFVLMWGSVRVRQTAISSTSWVSLCSYSTWTGSARAECSQWEQGCVDGSQTALTLPGDGRWDPECLHWFCRSRGSSQETSIRVTLSNTSLWIETILEVALCRTECSTPQDLPCRAISVLHQ